MKRLFNFLLFKGHYHYDSTVIAFSLLFSSKYTTEYNEITVF